MGNTVSKIEGGRKSMITVRNNGVWWEVIDDRTGKVITSFYQSYELALMMGKIWVDKENEK